MKVLSFSLIDNIRDIGRYETVDGYKVKYGKIYRSSLLKNLYFEESLKLHNTGIRTIIDLRSVEEALHAPDEQVTNFGYYQIPVFSDSATMTVFNQGFFYNTTKEILENILVIQQEKNQRIYKQFVTDPHCLRAYHKIFTTLINESKSGTLIHCTAGKDRTGFVIALILDIMGVKRGDILSDYLYSNHYSERSEFAIEKMLDLGVNQQLIESNKKFFMAQSEYLEGAFNIINERYGSSRNFLVEACHLDNAIVRQAREAFLEK